MLAQRLGTPLARADGQWAVRMESDGTHLPRLCLRALGSGSLPSSIPRTSTYRGRNAYDYSWSKDNIVSVSLAQSNSLAESALRYTPGAC
jgi:hypothetical protein